MARFDAVRKPEIEGKQEKLVFRDRRQTELEIDSRRTRRGLGMFEQRVLFDLTRARRPPHLAGQNVVRKFRLERFKQIGDDFNGGRFLSTHVEDDGNREDD